VGFPLLFKGTPRAVPDSGVRVNRGAFSSTIGMLCFSTKPEDMNECDALESNNTVVKTELTRNSLRTTPCAC
jgi:hypothetical protein